MKGKVGQERPNETAWSAIQICDEAEKRTWRDAGVTEIIINNLDFYKNTHKLLLREEEIGD